MSINVAQLQACFLVYPCDPALSRAHLGPENARCALAWAEKLQSMTNQTQSGQVRAFKPMWRANGRWACVRSAGNKLTGAGNPHVFTVASYNASVRVQGVPVLLIMH
jgi:hypothetical protein